MRVIFLKFFNISKAFFDNGIVILFLTILRVAIIKLEDTPVWGILKSTWIRKTLRAGIRRIPNPCMDWLESTFFHFEETYGLGNPQLSPQFGKNTSNESSNPHESTCWVLKIVKWIHVSTLTWIQHGFINAWIQPESLLSLSWFYV